MAKEAPVRVCRGGRESFTKPALTQKLCLPKSKPTKHAIATLEGRTERHWCQLKVKTNAGKHFTLIP